MRFLGILILTLPALAQIHVNAGGPSTGIYAADSYFTGGQAYTSPMALPAGGGEYLRTERYPAAGATSFSYKFPVADGSYLVTFHFIENSTAITAAGQRIFSVSLNGALIIPSIDLFATAGLNTEIVKQFPATAAGAGISVVFTTITRNAVVSAIDIDPAPAPSAIPCVLKGQRMLSCPGAIQSGAGSPYAPGITFNGVTYLFPVPDGTDTTNKFLRDSGVASCANVDPDVGATVCHQLVWAIPGA